MHANPAEENEIGLTEALQFGISAQQQGELEEAAEIYRRILEVWPECPDALHFSGLLAFRNKETDRAISLIEKSVELTPEQPGFWNNFGNVLKELGEKARATAAYQRAIDLQPDFADAYNNLGVMASQQGDFATAVHAYQNAINFYPAHADAHFNLGNAFEKLEMLDEAAVAYRATTNLRPGDPEAYGRLGHIFWQQGKKQEAISAIVANTELNPGDPLAFIFLGSIFFEQGQIEASIEAFRQAVASQPKHTAANRLLGLSLARCGRIEEAKIAWLRWIEADPDNPVPKHLLQAGMDDQIPRRAGDEFVVREFDRFAESFDQQLKHLQYKAPELIAEEVRKRLSPPTGTLDILDAGCGTGLCAPLLRPFARWLDGVDLSLGMLEKARERGCYDNLIAAELTGFISGKNDAYDLIVSADTLCYFGRLDDVLTAARTALRAGGYLIFTLEKTSVATAADVILEPSGRYTHTEKYVRSAVAETGLTMCYLSEVSLRMEYFKPVKGMLVVAQKPGG